MMTNNWQRMNILLNLKNKFDYQEFADACNSANCDVLNGLEFAQKAGLVMAGMTANPDLPAAEAYLKYVRDNQAAFTSVAVQARIDEETARTGKPPSANCCGGGEIK